MKLSVVIITFNEERNIARCVRSVQEVADEVVIVDSYSTDRTEELCRALGARFIQHPFDGHIEQKNWAVTQAKYPYVLSLDADEALSEPLKASILAAKQETQPADGYTMNRLTNYCGSWIRHCGWYPDRKLRLWDSRKGSWQGENPHDRYEMEAGSRIAHLKGDLLHYSYYSVAEHITQMQKFTDISARAKFRRGKQVSVPLIALRVVFTFVKKYIFKLGFLDGYHGFVISVLSVYTTFLKDIKLRELHQQREESSK